MRLIDLGKPFPAEDIEWRIQSSGKTGKGDIWAMVLAYVTNRAIMQRLDDICGPDKWKNDYRTGPDGGILCGISIKCGDEWVTKWDGAENTQVEAVKGGLSSAMKRAGSQWGIGRYLYNLDATFAECSDDKNKFSNKAKLKDNTVFSWETPILPGWALPADKPQAKKEAKVDLPFPDFKAILDRINKLKSQIADLDGNDSAYWEALKLYGVENATDFKTRDAMIDFGKDLKAYVDKKGVPND
jgi:hypothetical protein